MKLKTTVLLLSLNPIFSANEQPLEQPAWALGAELQGYPAGFIPGGRAEYFPDAMQNINLRIGYNIARRQDFGRHSDERGGGWGAGFGYRRYGIRERLPFFAGIRIDWWELTIDWQQTGNPINTAGQTRISVLQPTLELGYDWRLSSEWSLIFAAALGAEINVRTQGENVGEGAILLGSISALYRFSG